MIRVRRMLRPFGPGRAGTIIVLPFHNRVWVVPSPVITRSPGCKSSIATGPNSVSISEPREKAQKASSNSGSAGAIWRVVETEPFGSRALTS